MMLLWQLINIDFNTLLVIVSFVSQRSYSPENASLYKPRIYLPISLILTYSY